MERNKLQAEWQELRKMILSLRVTELHTLLVRAGKNKTGKKNILQERAIMLLPDLTVELYNLIHELYQLRFSAVRAFSYPANTTNYQANASSVNYRANATASSYQASAATVNYQDNAAAANYQADVASAANYQANGGSAGYQSSAPSTSNFRSNSAANYGPVAVTNYRPIVPNYQPIAAAATNQLNSTPSYQRNIGAANYQPSSANTEPPAFPLACELNSDKCAGNLNVNPVVQNQNPVSVVGGGPIRCHLNKRLPHQEQYAMELSENAHAGENRGCPYPEQNPLQRRRRDFVNVSSPKLTPSCFFDVIKTVVQPKVYVPSQNESELRECVFMFKIDDVNMLSLSREICDVNSGDPEIDAENFSENSVRLQLRVAKIKEPDDYLPVSLYITVNGRALTLPKLAPVNKTAGSMRRPCVPMDITHAVFLTPHRSNIVTLTWNREETDELPCLLGVSVHVVKRVTSDIMIRRLSLKPVFSMDDSRKLVMKKLNVDDDDDDEIAATTIRASVICPLGKMVIKKPCRALTCTHVQCFDGDNFIKMNEKKASWMCPVCDRPILFSKIRIDALWVNILSRVPENCREVEFDKYARWAFVKNQPKESIVLKDYSRSRKSPEVITIDSDSDDEPASTFFQMSPVSDLQNKDEADDIQCLFTVSSSNKNGEVNYGASTSMDTRPSSGNILCSLRKVNKMGTEIAVQFEIPDYGSSSDSD